MKPFWRTEPLSEKEAELVDAMFYAHSKSVARGNVSSETFFQVASGSWQYCNALAAAILSVGGMHAPLADTIDVLSSEKPAIYASVLDKVPGWGNSFEKRVPDVMWLEVAALIKHGWPDMHQKLEEVTQYLKTKELFPNPSAYTSAVAIIIGLPKSIAPMLFVMGRLEAWSGMFLALESER